MKNKKNYLTVICAILMTALLLFCLSACGEAGSSKKDALQAPLEYTRQEKVKKSVSAPVPAAQPSTMAVTGAEEGEADAGGFNTEEYNRIKENEFKDARQNPLSTFSIDVDNASYSNVRRFIKNNQMPPKDAVRIEELINYFTYDYTQPKGEHPFSINCEISQSPWNEKRKLVHIGLQGKSLNYDDLKPCNLVFLVDSSGSMGSANKLPLLKKSLGLLLDELDDKDKIAIAAYAGSAGLVLPSTPASEKKRILSAIDQLQAGGSTAGGAGIQLAYKVAKENLIKGGNNRVILATDGDFNVGVSSTGDLVRFIEEKRKDDIYLTICGFGMGNYKDSRMEDISNAGNGNYFYIDSIREAQKVFVKEMRANLFTIAKDVKIQVEFNPARVKAYRLIGYENRILANEDFEDDKKDAGELGAGHTVTALYEIIPAGSAEEVKKAANLKYQETKIKTGAASGEEILTVKFRYKPPKEEKSKLIENPLIDEEIALQKTSDNFRFSAAVAGFGMLLRDSKFKGGLTFEKVKKLSKGSLGKDEEGYRAEFILLVETCALLSAH
ncbi:MAG: von Willebrand factor type A domain-containing protein [Candidatus Aminicenantes bacterium]|nr:von Willebrand factor type A domain-containing protein [Candidatus Aminicenantes bacterium]